ncbi:hypothetical protein pEaSNUABM14_00253 [Erwinia phage pEa_SNUABM_14]|uniref:Uncharacterized protein n=1 Tax=Erwinia phage pEa_SNUABM_7 TaxID=2866695 RepID=A0AAE7WTS2_9CAUD|nr:hypothetical protein MPK74_gp254 [Erwinia phage pEa_SNUABM_7]QYW04578.1 hypothetical protein pEaSNUABM14_00253 [Erwinia phage pEa_SNUABM_14]QYW04922.1 hypothetical protein pEaSNUABM7_00254 [Erwinia phage pEa_SNUABM_7]
MSLVKLQGVPSLSAPTKAQKDAAIYMFGSKGHSIVAVLDKFSRAKEVRAPHLDGLLKLMKEGEDDEIIKFVSSAAGKKALANAKAFAVAKTLTASIKALKLIRVPMKWIDGHSDVAAARNEETKEIRARKTAGNRPEKPIKLDNPQAPAPVTPKAKPVHIPSGKSADTLVDEMGDIPARKISGKSMQQREEYLNALGFVIQRNIPRAKVNVSADSVMVTKGSKIYTIALTPQAWTLQEGVTKKPKRIGTTFDVVSILSAIDSSFAPVLMK